MTTWSQHLPREGNHHLPWKALAFLESSVGQEVHVLCPICLLRTCMWYRPWAQSTDTEWAFRKAGPPRPPSPLRSLPAQTKPTPVHPPGPCPHQRAGAQRNGSEAPGGHPANLPILQMRKQRPGAGKGIVQGHQQVSARAWGQGLGIFPLHPAPSLAPPTTLDPLFYTPT